MLFHVSRHDESFKSRNLFRHFFTLFFDRTSRCALAQEARETRLLVSPRLQRIDLITHQPFEEYFNDVYMLRSGWKSGSPGNNTWIQHFRSLSTLSRYILIIFFTVTISIILTEIFNPRANFSWADGAVLVLTFLQSFLVLGKFHKFIMKMNLKDVLKLLSMF